MVMKEGLRKQEAVGTNGKGIRAIGNSKKDTIETVVRLCEDTAQEL